MRWNYLKSWSVIVAVATSAAAHAQSVYTATPPRELGKLIDKLKSDQGWAEAIQELAKRVDAAPYLRMELGTATKQAYKQNLTEALKEIDFRVAKRNDARFARWTTERRIDLCAELIVGCPDKSRAIEFIDSLDPVLHELGAEAARRLDIPFGVGQGLWLPDRASRQRKAGFLHFAEESVSILRGNNIDFAVIRAGKLLQAHNDPTGAFVVVRSELRHPTESVNEWIKCVVLVNNTMPLKAADSSLIISDGDLELGAFSLKRSIIIANGDIRVAKDCRNDGGTQSFLCATGDIVLPARASGAATNVFHAGGTITFASKPQASNSVKEKQKDLPFGVKFLDPARDFGVEFAPVKGGLQFAKVAPWSPFAKFGVKPGDIVTRINEPPADTPSAFRRELRAGLLLESVTLHLTRQHEKLIRIVFLDGIPTNPDHVAPPPREVNPVNTPRP